MAERTTWVLVDGENIDATLGGSILRRRPAPDERPRWDRLLDFARGQWNNPSRGLFFLNASTHLPMGFVQALVALGYTPVPLSGDADEKIVDIAIQRTLVALRQRADDVMLVSHDRDFADDLGALTGPERRVGVIAFHEFRSQELSAIPVVELFDLEYDADAFDVPLDRLRVIPIHEFDPEQFLR
jgi:putative heme uptake system protein